MKAGRLNKTVKTRATTRANSRSSTGIIKARKDSRVQKSRSHKLGRNNYRPEG
jgi:hypothetical protein